MEENTHPGENLSSVGNDYFLIKFYSSDDYDKVLRESFWFIGDHFLVIKPWEPYFRALGENLLSVTMWVRFPELPIEFYDIEVLKEIGSAIDPVLRIDSYTAAGSRGCYARLCIQIDLDKPLIKSIRIGRLVQQVKYEGIYSLCFCCGRLGHKRENCCYKIKENNRSGVVVGKSTNQSREEDKQEDSRPEESPNQVSEQDDTDSNFGPWMLVTRKRNVVKNGRPRSPLGSEMKGDISLRGLNVQRWENMGRNSVKMAKDSVWSNHTEATHAVRDSSVPGFVSNEDLGNLEVRFTSSPKQREVEPRNDRKLQMGSLGAGARGYRSKGGTSAKSLNDFTFLLPHSDLHSQKTCSEESTEGVRVGRSSPIRKGWAIWLRNKLVEIPEEIILQIRATPTKELRWCEVEMGPALKNIFLITPESRRTGELQLDHLAWGLTPNPWWSFMTDIPLISWEESKTLSKQRKPSVRPHFDELGWVIQERLLVDRKGLVTTLMGNHPMLKLIQWLKSVEK